MRNHGLSKTPEYYAWLEMRRRCYKKNRHNYKNWGARGITVCDRWRYSFLAFYDDLGRRPSPQHSLDRTDNEGNYEPGNVKWSTRQEQSLNRRSKRAASGYKGVYWHENSKKWGAQIHCRPAKRRSLGVFTDKKQAALAYDRAALQAFGVNAVLNFPTSVGKKIV